MFTPGPPPVHFDDTDYENEPPLLEGMVLFNWLFLFRVGYKF